MSQRIQISIVLTLTCVYTFSFLNAQSYGRNGMVVSDQKIASEIGIEILKNGGNAIDASVAVAFALAVTFPQAGNIGGGGFIVFRNSENAVTTIDFREKAPLAAHNRMFQDENGKLIKNKNGNGLNYAGVPGTVAGLYLAHQKYGSLDWEDLVQPAIEIAENGFGMTWGLYHRAQRIEIDSTKDILLNYFRNGKSELIQPGELWQQPALANTLKYIRDKGKDGFYKGLIAKEIARYMQENGGLITTEDLEKYRAIERKPISGTYKDFNIYSMAPPSSGGVALIEMLNLVEQADMDSIEFNSTQYVHLIAEVMRRAYADRAEYLGDPDFNPDIPIDKLTSKDFAKMRFTTIDSAQASRSDSSKFGQIYDGSNTTHISVVDKQGNAVSLTYTLEHSFGTGMGSPKLGFIFNDEMGDFNPVPGVTTTKGQIGSAANQIAPEKRMLSSMTPTIVTKGDTLYLLVGTPGGRTIINTVFQTILCAMEYDMSINKAIEAMKIHHQWLPDRILYENYLLSPDTRKALIKMGHTLKGVNNLGNLMGISYDRVNKVYVGATDSASSDGGAVGY